MQNSFWNVAVNIRINSVQPTHTSMICVLQLRLLPHQMIFKRLRSVFYACISFPVVCRCKHEENSISTRKWNFSIHFAIWNRNLKFEFVIFVNQFQITQSSCKWMRKHFVISLSCFCFQQQMSDWLATILNSFISVSVNQFQRTLKTLVISSPHNFNFKWIRHFLFSHR